ncbi:MAG: hypothetical protein MUC94_09845 [bacterium]|nr:hypothetical protein [bacterium]
MIIKKIILSARSGSINMLLLFIIFVLLHSPLLASFELNGNSTRARAMGQAYIGLANTPDAIFINCAGLAQINHPSVSLYFTKPFGLKELLQGACSASFPTTLGNFSTGANYFGNEIYQEQSLLLSFSRSVRQRFSWGINLHYMKLQIAKYGSDFSLGIDIGFLTKITQKFQWGFFATNINRTTYKNCSEPLPQTFAAGISILPFEDLIINFDIFKDTAFPLELRMGLEYFLFQRIAFRAGFSDEPTEFCFGFGLPFSYFELDYAVTSHIDLGLTHYFSIQFYPKSKTPK